MKSPTALKAAILDFFVTCRSPFKLKQQQHETYQSKMPPKRKVVTLQDMSGWLEGGASAGIFVGVQSKAWRLGG